AGVEARGRPAPPLAAPPPAAPRPAAPETPARNGRPRVPEPERPGGFPGPSGTGPNGYARRTPSGTPPRPASPVAPPRQGGSPPAERRRYEPARPAPAEPPAPAPPPAPTTAPARPSGPSAPDSQQSRVASLVLTAAVVVLFTAAFETLIAPMLAGGSVLLRIVLLSLVITAGVTVVRPPALRRWLANLLVPVAVRNRWEAEGRPDGDAGP
ncbi:hypothetical protein KDL28_39475, partial [Pseudonocardia sp. S2-4]|nr:hypothetical protein [Pseudonocardia humida]